MPRINPFKVAERVGSLPISISPEPQYGTPEGRYPTGNGWYKTPDVIDPMDCANFPDSPWCGGNPLSRDIIGLDVNVDIHPCGFDVNAQGTLGYVKLPVHGFSWRREGECRAEPPPPPQADLSSFPKAENTSRSTGFNATSVKGESVDQDENVFCAITYHSLAYDRMNGTCIGDPDQLSVGGTYSVGVKLRCPIGNERHKDFGGFEKITEVVFESIRFGVSSNFVKDTLCIGFDGIERLTDRYTGGSYVSGGREICRWNKLDPQGEIKEISTINFKIRRIYFPTTGGLQSIVNDDIEAPPPYERIYFAGLNNNTSTDLVYGRYGFIEQYFSRVIDLSDVGEDPLEGEGRFLLTTCFGILIPGSCNGSQPYKKNPPPPKDDDEDKECCMTCCSQSNQKQDQNNDLLKKILKKVEKIEKRTWDGDDDVKMPASLRVETNWLSSVLPAPQKVLTNIPQLNTHIFKLFEEVVGEWDLNIQIKDTDPATPGEQPKGLKVPAISEAFGEVLGTTIQSTINTEVLINMLSRCLYEVGVNRQATMDCNYAVRALIDYFGFKTEDVEEKMPMAFTPGVDKIEEMLKEYEHKLQVIRFDDEKNSYKSDMAKILQMVARWNAQNYKTINGATVASGVADIVKRIKDLREAQSKQDEAGAKKLQEDFDAWVERYERGFTDIPNIDDPVNPYGEPLSQRPRVIRLDKQSGNDNTQS
jgi:hypothetical protein